MEHTSIYKELPERLAAIVRSTKLMGTIGPDFDSTEIEGGSMALRAGMQVNKIDPSQLSARDAAVGDLLFWVENSRLLSSDVYVYPKHALATHFAQLINVLWEVAPDLMGPKVLWTGDHRDVQLTGYILAEVLCARGILLDPDVLQDAPKNALMREFGSPNCIRLAVVGKHFGILDMITQVGPQSRALIYETLTGVTEIHDLCSKSIDALVNNFKTAPFDCPPSDMNAAFASRRLLEGMALANVKAAPAQIGWCNGAVVPPLDSSGKECEGALRCVAAWAISLAGTGYHLDGLQSLVREVGTIIGYENDQAGTKALVKEFAGAVALELVRVVKIRWPSNRGVVSLDPETNAFIKKLLVKYPSKDTGGGSFVDGLLNYFLAADIHTEDEVATGGVSLHYALHKSLPADIGASFEAACRARAMKTAIDEAVGQHDCDKLSSTPTRRRMIV